VYEFLNGLINEGNAIQKLKDAKQNRGNAPLVASGRILR
jgi:hypothetical protein